MGIDEVNRDLSAVSSATYRLDVLLIGDSGQKAVRSLDAGRGECICERE